MSDVCPCCGAPAKHTGYSWSDDSTHSPKDAQPLHPYATYTYTPPTITEAERAVVEAVTSWLQSIVASPDEVDNKYKNIYRAGLKLLAARAAAGKERE